MAFIYVYTLISPPSARKMSSSLPPLLNVKYSSRMLAWMYTYTIITNKSLNNYNLQIPVSCPSWPHCGSWPMHPRDSRFHSSRFLAICLWSKQEISSWPLRCFSYLNILILSGFTYWQNYSLSFYLWTPSWQTTLRITKAIHAFFFLHTYINYAEYNQKVCQLFKASLSNSDQLLILTQIF